MTKNKYDILDFFLDGEAIIMARRTCDCVYKIIESGQYMFATSENDTSLDVFLMHMLQRPCVRKADCVNIVLRTPYGKRDIQEEVHELVNIQQELGGNKCTWSVVEDLYTQTKIQVGVLAS